MLCSFKSDFLIFQTRVLEWVAISSSRGSSQSRDWTCISCIADRFFTTEALGKPLKIMLSLNFLRSLETFSVSLAIFLLLWILKKLSLCNLWNEDTGPRGGTRGDCTATDSGSTEVSGRPWLLSAAGSQVALSSPRLCVCDFIFLWGPQPFEHKDGLSLVSECSRSASREAPTSHHWKGHRHTWVWVLSLFISWVVSMLILPVLSPEFHHSAWSHIHSWTIMYWAPSVGPGPAHRAEHISASKMGKVPALIGFALPAGRETLSTFPSIQLFSPEGRGKKWLFL